MEANNTLGVLLCADNYLSTDSLIELDYAMGRPKKSVRELVGQVRIVTQTSNTITAHACIPYYTPESMTVFVKMVFLLYLS